MPIPFFHHLIGSSYRSGRPYLLRLYRCRQREISFFGGKKTETEIADKPDEVSTYDEPLPLEPVRSYQPPDGVESKILKIASSYIQEQATPSTSLLDKEIKFQILTKCMDSFNYNIPSSELADMECLSDVIRYFDTAWESSPDIEGKLEAALPKNARLFLEPVRFTDDTKDYFKGKTAFPERDTIVSSLKYRHKYKGYKNPLKYTKKAGFQYY